LCVRSERTSAEFRGRSEYYQRIAGVVILTITAVGGWQTLAMVQRYAHLAPGYLHTAVERLVSADPAELARH